MEFKRGPGRPKSGLERPNNITIRAPQWFVEAVVDYARDQGSTAADTVYNVINAAIGDELVKGGYIERAQQRMAKRGQQP